jgi:hypothetical protein
MRPSTLTARIPTLRIVPLDRVFPHEAHDPQRSTPLIASISSAQTLTNPIIVATTSSDRYVVLDGSNRYHSFRTLNYQHTLVQVVEYEDDIVDLGVWRHIISGLDTAQLLSEMSSSDEYHLQAGWAPTAIAEILLRDGPVYSVLARSDRTEVRNLTLRSLVESYHHRAVLHRTAVDDPTQIWTHYADAAAVVLFPPLKPQDILDAAMLDALLPPGVSRHIVEGRVLKLHFPLEILHDPNSSLEEKNTYLSGWLRERLASRSARFYAEATWIFDE